MGVLGVVLGVFLVFSAAIAWIGGDRAKAILEDTIKEDQETQKEMSQEVDLARDEAARKDEHIKELQDKLEESRAEKRNLERAVAMKERDKRIAGENKTTRGIWESAGVDDSGAGGGAARGEAAGESPGSDMAARVNAGKRFVIEWALQYPETELSQTFANSPLRGMPVTGAALCPWDTERR